MAADFEFKPDARINESELSEALNASRTPIREAGQANAAPPGVCRLHTLAHSLLVVLRRVPVVDGGRMQHRCVRSPFDFPQ